MDTLDEYLRRTESAVQLMFNGIQAYIDLIPSFPTFVASYSNNEDLNCQLDEWLRENESEINRAREAEKTYFAESFAQATLCGAVLQVAAKAIDCYSNNQNMPSDLHSNIQIKPNQVKYCVGRKIGTIPIGLIIYAGRNQHTHFEDSDLHSTSKSVLELLAVERSPCAQTPHPAFDLHNRNTLVSFANNITAILGWRSYSAYEADLRTMLS